ncbi:hypothetical protein [Micromonospora humidisoli]|uniref:MYXO-CTERM domain-containing protein n=1 Tax=Micromonospora humidisoli TaxID=2807622 RepID=A0ABS2JFI8_9ACTN|nr:hypothetical protein [Micromonospora humidisoli]MBM7084850.1 hypothetical protein [Micromonospora humidisoli]
MTDPYRIADAPTRPPQPAADRLRPLLGLALAVSVVANVVLTTVLDNQWAGSACGLLAVLCAGTLIARHRRTR